MALLETYPMTQAADIDLTTPADAVAASLLARALELVADGYDEIDGVTELVVEAGPRRMALLAAYNLAELLVDHLPGDDHAYMAFHWLGRSLHWQARLQQTA